MKTLFFGTPETAVPFLRLLASKTQVAAVVTQPDKPAGRGLSVAPTPVKAEALRLGLRVMQPEKPGDITAELQVLGADLALVVAYGRIMKKETLESTRLGFLNVHFSLLPKYRGAAPVQWAIVRGEKTTGVTLFWLDEGMDTGPIQASSPRHIGPDQDAASLLETLTGAGAMILDFALRDVKAGKIVRAPQTGEPSLAPLIKREDARIDLNRPAQEIHDLVRGFRIWPKASLENPEFGRLAVLRTRLAGLDAPPGIGAPGRVIRIEQGRGILVECGSCSRLWLLDVQPEGKKTLNAADFANGLRLAEGGFLPFIEK